MAEQNFQRLFVSLEARFNNYERALAKVQRDTNSSFARIQARGRTFERGLASSFNRVGASLTGAFAGAVTLRAAQSLIDTSTRISNALKVAGLEGEELTRVYDRLFDSAQKNAAPLESLVDLYGRVALVQKEIGATTEEMLRFTDNVAVALRVSGKSAAEASGALLQLSQAMGSGIVRAEEFNSLLEGALPIAQAAAAGLEEAGGSVAKLRQLVVDGKVSSEAFFRAFEAGSVILEDRVAGAELTISQRFVRLQNILVDTAGKFDDASGSGQLMAMALDQITSEVEAFGEWYAAEGPSIIKFFTDIAGAIEAIQNAGVDFGQATGLSGIGRWVEDITGLEVSIDYAEAGFTRLERKVIDAENAVRNFATSLLDQNSATAYDEELVAAVDRIIEKLDDGQFEAEETLDALNAIGDANPNFGPAIYNLSNLIRALQTVRAEAAAATAAASGAVTSRPWKPAEIDGQPVAAMPTTRPIQTVSLSDYELPGGGDSGSRSRAAAIDRDREAVERLITTMRNELDLRHLSNNARRAEEVLRQVGADVTDEQRRQIYALVDALDAEEAALERIQNALETTTGLAQTFARSLASDLRSGKSASEALENALANLAQQLLQMALDQAISGIVGALFSAFNPFAGAPSIYGQPVSYTPGVGYMPLASGGFVTGPGSATSDSIPARLSNGEYVINAAATARHRPILDAINSGAAIEQFSSGGIAGRELTPVTDMTRFDFRHDLNIKIEGDNAEIRSHKTRQDGSGRVDDIVLNMVLTGIAKGKADNVFSRLYGLQRKGA